MIFYDLFNRIFYKKKGHLIRLLLEIIFFLIMSLIFFIIMLFIANAKFNIFIPLFLFLGIITYMLLLENSFQNAYQFLFNKINNKINSKKMVLKNKFDIIKERRKKAKENKKYEKNKRSKRKNHFQKQN